jgi:hypothetical protein
VSDYDLLTIKQDPESGYVGVEWRGLFLYHGPRKRCEEYCLKFTEKLNQVKMERSNFDQLQEGDYLVRKREGRSYAAWRILNGKIALDGTPVRAQGQSIRTKLDDLENKSREEREREEVEDDATA